MIVITGSAAPASGKHLPWTDEERQLAELKERSPIRYVYQTESQLYFEMRLRREMVRASGGLADSGGIFAEDFQSTRCNLLYWILTEDGGFRLRDGIPPSDAIRDIFVNGRMYAYECAMAIVIILYGAVLSTIGEERFNVLFQGLYLRDWQYDSDLQLISVRGAEMFPGDIVYFKNPDVHPATPQWQGENSVVIGGGLFYGHGIGIAPAREIIAGLNRTRRPFSFRSAYLTDQVTFPDIAHMSEFSPWRSEGEQAALSKDWMRGSGEEDGVRARIGHRRFLIPMHSLG